MIYGLGLRLRACLNCGFCFRRGHEWFPFADVVCCQVEVSATGRSLVQRIPTDWDVCVNECDQMKTIAVHLQWGGRKKRKKEGNKEKCIRLDLYLKRNKN